MNTRTAAVTALACAVLGSIYLYCSPSPISFNIKKMSKPTPPLTFHLSQISTSPPSLLATLRNASPQKTYTLLRWSTPLDPQALNLGVFKIAKISDSDTREDVAIDRIMVNRKLPPSKEDLVEIGPGEEYAVEVVFDRPGLWEGEGRGRGKHGVKVKGEVKGVWEKGAGDVGVEELEDYSASTVGFESEEVVMVVD